MEWTIECIESPARPAVASLTLKQGESARIFALADALEVDTGLRATVLRKEGQDPPASAELILAFEMLESGGQTTMRVLGNGGEATVDWLRSNARTRVGSGTLLRSGSRLEATIRRQRRVQFTLIATGDAATTSRTVVAGSGTRKSQALAAANGATWLAPTAWKLATDMTGVIIDNATAFGNKLGLSREMVAWSTIAWFAFAGMAVAFYGQSQATEAAEDDVASAQEDLDLSEAARAIALEAEQACLTERTALADRLGDVGASMALQADRAIAASGSQGVAIELGGARMGTDEVAAFDAVALADLSPEVARRMGALPPADVSACLSQRLVLGSDLPTYLLVWHPDANLACPIAYGAVVDGTSLAGRWGLSERVAREFGAPDAALEAALRDDPNGADARSNDRWSALTLAAGARAVLTTVLQHDSSGRVPVAPGQAQVWALTLFGAYNSMPTQADGVLDWKAAACVDQLLDDLAATAPPAAPGAPLLPEITLVASGEVPVVARPTPGCPWPSDAIAQGSDSALRAIARLAVTPESASVDVESP